MRRYYKWASPHGVLTIRKGVESPILDVESRDHPRVGMKTNVWGYWTETQTQFHNTAYAKRWAQAYLYWKTYA